MLACALALQCARARSMANWRLCRTDYDKSTVANRQMANWHMAKRRHIKAIYLSINSTKQNAL